MAAVVSLFSSSRRSPERERERRGRKEGKTGGGSRREDGEGGAGGHQGSAPAKLRLTRTPPLFVHSAHPAARSPLAYASLFSKSEAPQLRRRERSKPSAPSACPQARVTRSRRGSPRPAPPRPPRLSRDPPAAEAEPAGGSSELAHLLAPECRQTEKKESSLWSPLFLTLSKNLFKVVLRAEDIFFNSPAGAGSAAALR